MPQRFEPMGRIPEAILPVSTTTWRWLKQGRAAGMRFRRHGLAYAWNAFWFDINLRLQRRLLADIKSRSLADSVFVLGLWRSGTTLAHELLSGCPGFVAPATGQCMNASTFGLSRAARGVSVARPMDAMSVTHDSPQEDEFALLALGIPTAYRAFLDPSRIGEQQRVVSPDYWTHEAPPAWHEEWLDFLHLARRQQKQDARLVIKSPGHSFRIKAIERFFSDARYLWITRAPDEVLYSNRKMWKAMFRRYGMTHFIEDELDRFLLQACEQAAGCLDWLCERMGRERLAVIDFGDLTTDPASAVAAAGKRLGLGDEAGMRAACEATFQRRSGYRQDRYPSRSLSAHEERVLSMLDGSQRRALASHGGAA